MKIALVHDWLAVNAGSEKVVKQLLILLKSNDVELYTLFNALSPIDEKDILQQVKVHVSWLNYFPFIDSLYKYLLPVLPFFIKQLHPQHCDFYLSSSHAVAKGFKADPQVMHICYCHTPMRYAWYQRDDYIQDENWVKRNLIKFLISFIRKWDLKSVQQVHHFIANSNHIQQQIKEIYGRDSDVIYPPVQVEKFSLNVNPRKDFYLAVGRFVSYKKIDIIVKAFKNMKDKKLVLIGDGTDAKKIQKLISGFPNIVWLGYQHEDELILYMQNAKACIFAAKEDFGITCVEAQATGTPILALNYGGYKETVIDGVSGYFFEDQSEKAIEDAVSRFEKQPLTDHQLISQHAYKFSEETFNEAMKSYLTSKTKMKI